MYCSNGHFFIINPKHRSHFPQKYPKCVSVFIRLNWKFGKKCLCIFHDWWIQCTIMKIQNLKLLIFEIVYTAYTRCALTIYAKRLIWHGKVCFQKSPPFFCGCVTVCVCVCVFVFVFFFAIYFGYIDTQFKKFNLKAIWKCIWSVKLFPNHGWFVVCFCVFSEFLRRFCALYYIALCIMFIWYAPLQLLAQVYVFLSSTTCSKAHPHVLYSDNYFHHLLVLVIDLP